jgi:hypothetical protein
VVGLRLSILRRVRCSERRGERKNDRRPDERSESLHAYSRNPNVAITLPELTITYCLPSIA